MSCWLCSNCRCHQKGCTILFSFRSTSKVPGPLSYHVGTWIRLLNYWKTNLHFMVGPLHSCTAPGRETACDGDKLQVCLSAVAGRRLSAKLNHTLEKQRWAQVFSAQDDSYAKMFLGFSPPLCRQSQGFQCQGSICILRNVRLLFHHLRGRVLRCIEQVVHGATWFLHVSDPPRC